MNGDDWVRRLVPVGGELLSSCLARNAFAHGLPPYRFLNHVWEHDPIWNRDFDRDPAGLVRIARPDGSRTTWIDDIADRLRIASDVVADATLAGWLEALGTDPATRATDSRLVLSAGIHHRTRKRHALQYCPDCLATGIAHFRKVWRLGFATWCPDHARMLRDACPHCDAAVIPHRSMTNGLVDCHLCGKDLTKAGRADRRVDVPVIARRLQALLLGEIRKLDASTRSPLGDGSGAIRSELSLTVRALLAASAPPAMHDGLRRALGLPTVDGCGTIRRRFEHTRLAVRVPWLETIATWMEDWPHNFLVGAEAIGASGRTFARCCMSRTLTQQVAKLPARRKPPRRPWEPLLDEPVINRLRRHDKDAYHALRVQRIMSAIALPQMKARP